jgi:3'-5' exoribonuclease
MERSFRELIGACGEPVKGFLEFLFFKKNIWRDFNVWPAAVSLHHAYVGGLLEHSVSVARSAAGIARSYLSNEGQGLGVELDIVIAGALLHDLGKLEAYRLSPTPEMTLEGSVMEHIILGYHRLMGLAKEYGGLDGRRLTALGHILVSHHGSREFGSPVLPATPEALIVAMADDLDFKLFCWKEQVSLLEGEKEITEFVAPVQRRFWKSHAPENSPPENGTGK